MSTLNYSITQDELFKIQTNHKTTKLLHDLAIDYSEFNYPKKVFGLNITNNVLNYRMRNMSTEEKNEIWEIIFNIRTNIFDGFNKNMDIDPLGLPLKLSRQPTRLTNEIGKYSYIIEIDQNTKYSARINIMDLGIDLYKTKRGRRRLNRAIREQMGNVDHKFYY